MTFDEWVRHLARSRNESYSTEEKVRMWSAWTMGRASARAGSDDGCKPFDAQGEIAELRRELKELTERVYSSLALDERHGRKPKPNNFQGY